MVQVSLKKVIDVVRAASTLMDRTGGFEVHDKGVRENIVTSSDLAVQHFLIKQLGLRYPEVGFLCEEEDLNDVSGHEAVWVIDPIDGTANYARGNENCCISVALVEKGEPVLAVVFSPWRGELYTAEKGKGAFCNEKPLHVSNRPFEQGLLFTAMSTYHKEWSRYCSDIIYDLYQECNDVRRTGSAAVELCLMAAGYADLYFEIRLMSLLRDPAHALGLCRRQPHPYRSRRCRVRFRGESSFPFQALYVRCGQYTGQLPACAGHYPEASGRRTVLRRGV